MRVAQDVRGKFKSEGKYVAFGDDMLDGYDTIEWIAKQSWSNGKVGMYGPSAMGITQNLAAIANPPYRKISSESAERRALRCVGIETSNLYTGFVALTLRCLVPALPVGARPAEALRRGNPWRAELH